MNLRKYFSIQPSLLFAVFLIFITPAGGKVFSDDNGSLLTLTKAVGLAVENSHTLAIAEESTNAAYEGYRIAKSAGYPQLVFATEPVYGLGVRRDYDFDAFGDADFAAPGGFSLPQRTSVTHSFSAGLEFSQLLPTGGSAVLGVGDTLDYRIVLEEDDLDGYKQFSQRPELSVLIEQPVFVGGRFIDGKLNHASRRVAEIGWEKSRQNEKSLKNREILTTVQLYLRLLALEKNIAFLEERLRLAEDQLAQVRIDFEQGRASSNQILGLEVSANRQEEAILDARLAQVQAQRDLARILGVDDLSEFQLIDGLSGLKEKVDEVLKELSPEHELDTQNGEGIQNPELAVKRLEAEKAKWEARLNAREGAPTVGLNFSLSPRYPDEQENSDLIKNSFTDFFEEGSGVDLAFGVNLRIPVTDGGRKDAQRKADASAQAVARMDLNAAVDDLQDRMKYTKERDRLLIERLSLLILDRQYQQNRLEREENLAESQTVTKLSVEKIRLEYTAALDNLWQTEADLVLNRLDLLNLYGYPLEGIF